MTLQEWLPITRRNRLALCFAFLSLLIFVCWNCLPYYDWPGGSSTGPVLSVFWPEMFSPRNYLNVLRSPDADGFLEIAASLALIQSGLVTLLAVPFWKLLHGSVYVRLPLAIVNLLGGLVVTWHLLDRGLDDTTPYAVATLTLMALSMFALSTALFGFENELGSWTGQ